MRSFGPRRPVLVFSLLIAGTSLTDAQGPRRVETAVAITHVVKKVAPEVPPEAAKAKVGGTVIADVTISAAGTVSSITILDGPPMLHAAAEHALRQWTFKPFLLRGRPGAVQAILEVSFPDPVKEAEQRLFDAYRQATYECQRQLEADGALAEAACAEALRHTEALPPDRVLERSHAVASYAQSLLAAGRLSDAIAQFEKAREIRATRARGPNADTADLYQVLALLHLRMGDYDKADEEFASAIGMYTAAQARAPEMGNSYAPRLRQALVGYAALKRLVGDDAGAAELEGRAATIEIETERPAPPERRSIRSTADGIQIVEPSAARLTDDDLRQIQALLAAARRKPWRLDVGITLEPQGRTPTWTVEAFLEPEVSTPAFRRGGFALLTTAPPPGTRETSRVWRQVEGSFSYIQIPAAGGDETPIRVRPAPNSPLPSDDELLRIVTLVRDRAVSEPSERLLSDIQPWPVTGISVGSNGDVHVDLSDRTDANRRQRVRMRKVDGQWRVIEVQPFGLRPY